MLLRELASSANEEVFVVYDEQDSFLEPAFYIPFGKNTVMLSNMMHVRHGSQTRTVRT